MCRIYNTIIVYIFNFAEESHLAYLKLSRLNFEKRFSLTPVQLMVLGYFLFTITGTILLILPFSLNPGMELNLIDAFFTATSAISVTGLNVVSTPDTFSFVV